MLEFPINTPDEIRLWLDDLGSPDHPFCGFVGNQGAIQMALDLAYAAHSSTRKTPSGYGWDYEWCDRHLSTRLLLVAPRSAGKTDFSRRFAKLLGTPFAEVDATSIVDPMTLVDACKQAWESHPLVIKRKLPRLESKQVLGEYHLELPPMTLFIDEVHAIPFQDKILKLSEIKDSTLVIRDLVVGFKNVCIIAATTEPGKLKDSLKSRFEPRLELDAPTIEMVAQIVKNNNPDWDYEDCRTLANLRRIPRIALSFAQLVKACKIRSNTTIANSIECIRKRLFIYNNGLTRRVAQILRSLANHRDGLSRQALLGCVDGLNELEFTGEILPLLSGAGNTPPLIMITNRHRITEAGLVALQNCEIEEEKMFN